MIIEYYASKKNILQLSAPVPKYWPGSVHQPGYSPTTETERAQKRGLTVEEYRARVVIVAQAQRECKFQVGDTVWPYTAKEAKKMGKCVVTGVCRHYDDYGTVDWNDPPFLLAVQSLSDRSKTIQCSIDWVVKQAPEGITEITYEC